MLPKIDQRCGWALSPVSVSAGACTRAPVPAEAWSCANTNTPAPVMASRPAPAWLYLHPCWRGCACLTADPSESARACSRWYEPASVRVCTSVPARGRERTWKPLCQWMPRQSCRALFPSEMAARWDMARHFSLLLQPGPAWSQREPGCPARSCCPRALALQSRQPADPTAQQGREDASSLLQRLAQHIQQPHLRAPEPHCESK